MQAHPAPIISLHQAPGSLSYRLREPIPSRPRACVILLHGVGGNETNLAELASAIDPSVLVVLPRGPLQLAPDQYAWFKVAFTADGPRLDPAEANQARESLLGFIAEIEAAHELTSGQVVIAGFSQGGIMSASVALSAPERVLGFGILSGRILPELAPHLASRKRLSSLRAFISHGELDNVLPVSWAQHSEQWLAELGVDYLTRRYAAGHTLTAAMQADFLDWCAAQFGKPAEPEASLQAVCADIPSASLATLLLDIGASQIRLLVSEGAHAPAVHVLGIGAETVARTWFKHEPPEPAELENAIMAIEDALAGWRTLATTDSRLFAQDQGIHEIAEISGLPFQAQMVLSRDTIEHTFTRLLAVTQGRPASAEGIPESKIFAARLLILREFMHHMKFESITLKA